jgi:AAA+ ATPase superfamily predicted ATPase
VAGSTVLVDREKEREALLALRASPAPSLGLLYGRRRVGKTFLLQNVWEPGQAFYFLASDTTAELNRRELLREAAIWTGVRIQEEDYPTWRTVFRLLTNLRPGKKSVVILDEFQYLLRGEENAASQLVAVWDQLEPTAPVCLILCGSAVRIMEHLDSGDMPLYGRFAWKHRLEPFDYWDTARMAPFRDLRNRAEAYGALGGTPRYLTTLELDRSLERNLARVFLSPHGEVRIQVESLIEQEGGLAKTPEYKAILSAVGTGRTEVNEIAARTGLTNGGALRYMLKKLVELGYLEHRRNFGAARNQPYRYYLADPALRFYHGLILKHRSELEIYDPFDVWKNHMREGFNSYMGLVFEQIVKEAFARLANELGFPMVKEWERWEGVDRQREPLEVDVIARIDRKRIMTGSVKWNRKPVGADMHTSHMRTLERLAGSGQGWAQEALLPRSPLLYAAAGGFKDGFVEVAGAEGRNVYLLSLEDIYKGLE